MLRRGQSTHSTQTSSDEESGRKQSPRTIALLLAACFIDGADVQLLPASFRALEADLGFTPGNLAQLAMTQAFFMAALAPFWGSVADTGLVPKRVLLTVAVGSWGVLTMLQSTATNLYAMMVIRMFIGCCLACILPLSQAIIAHQMAPEERGRIFGWVSFCQNIGQVCSALLTTTISNQTFWLSGTPVMGWRIAYCGVGVASVGLAMVIAGWMEEPPRRPSALTDEHAGIFSDVFVRIGAYSQISSWRLIVLQGIVGSIPWGALNFLSMWFQYVGFKDEYAAVLVMFMMIAMAFGNLCGGYLGDLAAGYSRFHGRTIVAQISVLAGIPGMLLLFRVVSPSTDNFIAYACVLWCHGLMAAWVMPGTKRPMLSELVKDEDWASLLALDAALEGASQAMFGAPIVAFMAERCFGYMAMTGQVSLMVPAMRIRNQDALSSAMLWMTAVPWTICFITWSFMHISYPRDLKAIEDYATEDDVEGMEKQDAPLLKFDDDGCTSGY